MLRLPISPRNWPLAGDRFVVRWGMTTTMRCWRWVDARTLRATPAHPFNRADGAVDVVETIDSAGFLQAINWAGLTAGRPVDGVFEVINQPG